MDQNENIFVNKASAPPLKESGLELKHGGGKEPEQSCLSFGWGKFRPRCLQFLNSPKWFLIVIMIYTLCQGIGTLGLQSLVLPSIERRFSLSSKDLGVIAGANDITALLLVVFISYYGDYGNKIKWIGAGVVCIGCGLLLFGLPHFMVGKYEPVDIRTNGRCSLTNTTTNQRSQNCKGGSVGEWSYMMVFVSAQLIIGAGTSPFFSLLPAYLDENLEPKSMPIFLGIWYCSFLFGPGLGYLIGGKFLSIYVDIKQYPGQNLTPKDPRWIGAWWIGFFIFGSVILLFAVIILGFPREMPGAKERRQKHIREGNLKETDGLQQPRLRDILTELRKLLSNWTFLFNTLGFTLNLLYGATVVVFISKIFRIKFGLDPVTTGYVLAPVTMIAVAIGNLCGSVTVRMLPLKETCKKTALVCLVVSILGTTAPLTFLTPGCMNSNIAGISVNYHSGNKTSAQLPTTSPVSSFPLTSHCNTNCGCSLKAFSPVCGSNSVTYFDACHAGCTVRLPNRTFSNCSCVPGALTSSSPGTAKPGYCDRKCKNYVIFAVLSCLVMAVRISGAVPGKIVTIRCVPDNKRVFALGIQHVTLKALGLLPGPIIFGHLIDLSCRLWQDTCGKKGRCFDYDIETLSRTICFFGVGISSAASLCYFLSWYLYKAENRTVGGQVFENQGAEQQSGANETKL